ncbi:putative tail protein [Pelagibacter phage HTVC112P]|nr:putative tail protein [Pelagibacter phage HTVC112P]|tara:strand:- start:427 stop:813 length:387 start_codon:yes stop_codon:yes gene_type:complete
MATHHGKEGVVTAGGSAVGELTSFTLETTADVVEDTALIDSTKSFVTGRTSFSGTLEMNYDETDSPQQTLTAGTSISFILLPEGNASGDEKFSGTGIITGMSVNNSMDAIVSRTVTFQGTGALTRATV